MQETCHFLKVIRLRRILFFDAQIEDSIIQRNQKSTSLDFFRSRVRPKSPHAIRNPRKKRTFNLLNLLLN